MRYIATIALLALAGCGPYNPGPYQPIDLVGALNAANLAYVGANQPPPIPQVTCFTTRFMNTSTMTCR